jgi:predicted AAA+ superfamily ATPase
MLPRLYDRLLKSHFEENRQMAFLAGPRQVGKTEVARGLADVYLNFDNLNDRAVILKGPSALAGRAELDRPRAKPPILALDEIHKFQRWKSFLKGFFDVHSTQCRILATGSARMDIFRKGGDSLLGRYFLYHQHPFSVGEILRPEPPATPLRESATIPDEAWEALWRFGGFPEPMVRQSAAFLKKWQTQRMDLLLREDVRDLTRVQELRGIETMGHLLAARSGGQLILSNLAGEISASVDTVRRWVAILSDLYVGFELRPWFKNVAKSLRKEPKWYLRDWSSVTNRGARVETFAACHFLKAVETWTDLGLGSFELRYLRDKQKREVDFAIIRDGAPWILIEVKASRETLSPHLFHFQKQTGAAHAFQAVFDLPHEPIDCFAHTKPVIVPLRTLLSQLA